MSKQHFLLIAGFIGLLLLGALGGRLYFHGHSDLDKVPVQSRLLAADPNCDPVLHTCTAGNGDMMISLHVQDKVRPLQKFSVQVKLGGGVATTVSQVSVRFDMADMDMGENRFQLSRQAEGIWQGQALLPVCSHGGRNWRTTVEAVGEAVYKTEFNLYVED
jgi:hypothetical protein